MPRDACIRTTPEDRLAPEEVWTVEADLLALLVEITSVPAAGKRLRKPVDIPRPKRSGKSRPAQSPDDVDAAYKRGINVLAASARRMT